MATILIVDDHVLNRQFLMVLLGYSGHRLVEANDGAQGLELARSKKPDLVIADILMPNMDGYEFVMRLRRTPGIEQTPVIFYTAAYHEREAITMAHACGVKWTLPKPSDPELILKTVHEALGIPHAPLPAPLALTANAPLAGLDSQLSEYLETSSALMQHLVDAGETQIEDLEGLRQVVQRLANALTSLQAVSLRLTALIELGIELAGSRDEQQLLKASCRCVQDICVARHAAIGILDASGIELAHYYLRGVEGDDVSALSAPRPRAGPLGIVLGEHRTVRLEQLSGSPVQLELPAAHPEVSSLLAVPISSQDRVFGWLYLCNKLGAPAFSEVDERAALTVAAQFAVVYENLSLYAKVQRQHGQLINEVSERKQAQDTLRRSLRARTVMAECQHVMVHAQDEALLLQRMCQTLVETGGYRMASIGYLGPDGQVRTVAQAGTSGSSAPPGLSPSAALPVAPDRAWVTLDLTAPDRATEDDNALALSLPLREHKRSFGVLTIIEAGGAAFDQEHIAMLQGLADDIAYGVTSLRTRRAREKAERDLRATEEKLSSILDSIDNVVWSATTDEFIYLNSMVEKIHGRPLEAFYRNRQLWFDAIHPDDRAEVEAAHARLAGAAEFVHEYRIIRPDGEVRWIEERARAIRDARGHLVRFDGIAIDISERKAYEARIEYLADHDALTGLANRNLLGDRATQAIAQARRHGQRLALLFLDLDRFKGVNDSFGHALGDALLVEVSKRLTAVVREGDTVARQGGDEFIVLLTGVQRVDDVLAVVNKIFQAFAQAFMVQQREVFVTACVGVTLFPEDGDNVQVLLRNADTAMYRAKERRGNAFQFYSQEMSVHALERAELENALRGAVERKEFELHYQPRVDATSGRIVGAEALIRWNHPQMGLVSPSRFIPLAEEIGLIGPIGSWVLHTACAQNKAWQQAGLTPISVSVNLSARQFSDDGLVQAIAQTLEHMELAPHHLELELTETVVMNSAELFVTKLEQLEELGVQLSIDDFGTGYSSLSYLKRFPLHHLKIDQSFVRDIATDSDDAAITSTVISLGHSLDLKVVAEGVETEEQIAFLREHGCDEMQGYYFSRPLPARDFAALLGRA